jgi:hypothetical protein
MSEAQPGVPQAGFEFIREMALNDGVDVREVKVPAYQSGECTIEKFGKNGAWLCDFVIEPGPEAKRVVLTQKARDRHPIVAAVHDTVEYTELPHHMDPHRHVFAPKGRPISPHEAVTAILHLADFQV